MTPGPPGDAVAVLRSHRAVARRLPLPTLTLIAPLAAGVLAWGVSVHTLSHVALGPREVPGVLPPLWWLGLAAVLGGAVFASCSLDPRWWIIAAYVVGLALILYATIPLVSDAPQYDWTYKHIGVVRLIEMRGAVSPSVDIYNRWPGFFSAAAALTKLMGLGNPVSYAGWSEPLFALIDGLLVAALAWSVLRDTRITGLAAVLFTAGNWIGQGYFSPQATVFPLALAMLLITVRCFASGVVGRRTMRVVELVVRRRQLPQDPLCAVSGGVLGAGARGGARRQQAAWGAAIVAADAAIVASHQLTPYVVLLQLASLAVIGIVRPRWLVILMAAVTIGYLLPNLGYIAHHYGLFTSLDPFSNAQARSSTPRPTVEPWIYQHAGQLLALLFLGGAGISSVLLARRGLGQRALPLIMLAAAPVGLLFGQGYGGEASLRTFLFSAPWGAILIAWAIVAETGPRRRPWTALAISALVATLFVPAYLGQTWVNLIPRGEVAASEYFYAHAPRGAALVLAGPDFPTGVGPRYALMRPASQNEGAATLIEGLLHDARSAYVGPPTVAAVADLLRRDATDNYLVFSTTGYRITTVDALAPPGALGRLERAIGASSAFELWHASPDARIYHLLNPQTPRHTVAEAKRTSG